MRLRGCSRLKGGHAYAESTPSSVLRTPAPASGTAADIETASVTVNQTDAGVCSNAGEAAYTGLLDDNSATRYRASMILF